MKTQLFLFALVSVQTFAQNTDINKGLVLIDPKGHSANIKSVRFTDDGKYIISASDDKTARVWDAKSGELVNTLRGEIDEQNFGMLNSGTLLPGKPIAVFGGYLNPPGNSNQVRFFNYETGEMLGVGSGPKGSVIALDFSHDGEYLAGGTTNGEIAIWKIETMKPIKLSGHKSGVYGVAFSPDRQTLVTASYDSTVIFWNLDFLKTPDAELKFKVSKEHKAEVRALAFSPKGDFVASGGYDNRVLLYNSKGEFVKELIKVLDPELGEEYGLGDIHSLAFSDDGKKIAIGTGLSNFENVWIVDVATGKKLNSFFKHDNSVMALDFQGNNVVSAGGDNRDIYVWDATTGKVISSARSVGRRISAVGFGQGKKIAFSRKMNKSSERKLNEFGKVDEVFDLENFTFTPFSTGEEYKLATSDYDHFTLRVADVQTLVIYDTNTGAIVNKINLDPSSDGSIRSYTFTGDGRIVIGTNYRILICDNAGNILRELNGHNAEIYSVASKDNLLLSGSADQTIKLWDLNDEGHYPQTKDQLRVNLKDQGVTDEKLKQYLEQNKITFDQLYESMVKRTVTPVLTFFPGGEDWIVFNNKNYYATSKNGSKFVGLHINQGADKVAQFYHFRQFDLQLNRPDLVLADLKSTNTNLMAALKLAHDKRVKRSGYLVPENNTIKDVPELSIRNLPSVVQEAKFKLRFNLSGIDLKKVNVTVNSVPVELAGGDLKAMTQPNTQQHIIYDCNFQLSPGRNAIELWATDTRGVSSTVRNFTIIYDPPTRAKENLYVVSIGVSKYSQKEFNLTYAAKDAQDIAKIFSSTGAGKVFTLQLADEQFNQDALPKIKSFLDSAKITDHVIFFYAGHGVFDGQYNYLLASNDMDFKNPALKGVSYESIEKILSGVKARNKLLMMDACHSGEIDKEEIQATITAKTNKGPVKFRDAGSSTLSYKSGLGMESSFALMKGMFADLNNETGANVISSAGGLELAMESDKWKNGLFTFAILDALQTKKADLDKNGKISVSELSRYVRDEVSKLSEGKQIPTTRTENIEGDFIVWN